LFHDKDVRMSEQGELVQQSTDEMRDHGITPVTWSTVANELQRDWSLPPGQDLGRVFHDHYQRFGLLMDSFEAKTARETSPAHP
jgi:hypothetical protein